MFVSFLKRVPLWPYECGRARNFENLCLFPLKQPLAILSTICVALNCEAEMFIYYAP